MVYSFRARARAESEGQGERVKAWYWNSRYPACMVVANLSDVGQRV